MDEARINAAIAEMNNIIQALIQRNISLAGDLAVAKERIISQDATINQLTKENQNALE